jgi:hypothetical protein
MKLLDFTADKHQRTTQITSNRDDECWQLWTSQQHDINNPEGTHIQQGDTDRPTAQWQMLLLWCLVTVHGSTFPYLGYTCIWLKVHRNENYYPCLRFYAMYLQLQTIGKPCLYIKFCSCSVFIISYAISSYFYYCYCYNTMIEKTFSISFNHCSPTIADAHHTNCYAYCTWSFTYIPLNTRFTLCFCILDTGPKTVPMFHLTQR